MEELTEADLRHLIALVYLGKNRYPSPATEELSVLYLKLQKMHDRMGSAPRTRITRNQRTNEWSYVDAHDEAF